MFLSRRICASVEMFLCSCLFSRAVGRIQRYIGEESVRVKVSLPTKDRLRKETKREKSEDLEYKNWQIEKATVNLSYASLCPGAGNVQEKGQSPRAPALVETRTGGLRQEKSYEAV